MKVIPVGMKILVKEAEVEKYFKGTNILIPAPQRKSKSEGVVVGIGEGVSEIKVGDTIKYSDKASKILMEHNGEDHYLINKGDVFAIIKYE